MTPPGDRPVLLRKRDAAAKLAAWRRSEEDAAALALARARADEEAAHDRFGRATENLQRLRDERARRRERRFAESPGARAGRAGQVDDEDRAARAALHRAEEAVRTARTALEEVRRLAERLRGTLAEAVAARSAAEGTEERLAADVRRLDEEAAELEQEDVAAARQHAGRKSPHRS